MAAFFAAEVKLVRINRKLASVVIATLFAGCIATSNAQEQKPKQNQSAAASAAEVHHAIPPERSVVTKHLLTLNGQTLHYSATAGTLLIRNKKGEPYGSMFYVAYTVEGANPDTRPVTFLYNGGPGSASIWLHMGSVGPVRVITDSPQATGPAPYKIIPNQYSLLNESDLVFIDAPLTGYSRAVGKGTAKDFNGVDEDLKAFTRFIVRYITVNQRWNSPKFLMGESYGTTRSAGLVSMLQSHGVSMNGVILLSSILNYNDLAPGQVVDYMGYLPSYAAIADYYHKLKNTPPDLMTYLKQVRKFAGGPYAEALWEGDRISPQKFDAIAQQVADYTGLSVKYVKDSNLRIDPSRFRKELLRGDGEILGRYDARFEGTDTDNAGATPGYDPSDSGITGVFVAAFNNYVEKDLRYTTTKSYRVDSGGIRTWDWSHRPTGQRGFWKQRWPDVAVDLADAMRKDPKLKVFSANGLYDLATPFYKTEYDISQMMLAPKLVHNVQFHYYPSGHMIYLNVQALKELTHDLDGFYASFAQP